MVSKSNRLDRDVKYLAAASKEINSSEMASKNSDNFYYALLVVNDDHTHWLIFPPIIKTIIVATYEKCVTLVHTRFKPIIIVSCPKI